MAADNFFSRWDKSKSSKDASRQHGTTTEQNPTHLQNARSEDGIASEAVPEALPPPTLDDVAGLTSDSDFSRFVGKDVDETVKRSAMKKLFSNPHFNVMDRLDVYIDDYNQFTPLTATMLASLNHAKDLLKPLQKPEQGAAKIADSQDKLKAEDHLSTAESGVAEPGPDSIEASLPEPDEPDENVLAGENDATKIGLDRQASSKGGNDQHLSQDS